MDRVAGFRRFARSGGVIDDQDRTAGSERIVQFRQQRRTVDPRPAVVRINVIDVVVGEHHRHGIVAPACEVELVVLGHDHFDVAEPVVGVT